MVKFDAQIGFDLIGTVPRSQHILPEVGPFPFGPKSAKRIFTNCHQFGKQAKFWGHHFFILREYPLKFEMNSLF